MGFKDHVANDLKNIYTNILEHAELTRVRYNSKRARRIPVIFDGDRQVERLNPPDDNVSDVFIVDMVIYIAAKHLNTTPRKDTRIEVGNTTYDIMRVSDEDGIFRLWLNIFDD